MKTRLSARRRIIRLRSKNKAGAIIGIYGNSKQEATYPIYTVDAAGEKLDGAKTRYALQFPPGQLQPVQRILVCHMYELPFSDATGQGRRLESDLAHITNKMK
jgi:hypothetical protein